MVRCDGELARGLEGWNTLDTDNNEKRPDNKLKKTALVFVAAVQSVNALGRVPAVRRRVPPWMQLQYLSHPSHRSNP